MPTNPVEPDGDGQLALNSAKAFFVLAGSFFKEIEADIESGSPRLQKSSGKLVAASTNLAFAVELYLKGFAIKTVGRAKRGHSLIDLFEALPTDVKQSIENRYNYRVKHDRRQKFTRLEFSVSPNQFTRDENQKATTATPVEDVRSLLKLEQGAFQNWRYFYEKASPSGPATLVIRFHLMAVLVNSLQDLLVSAPLTPSARNT
jgi:HEPN domain-containing protein